jgi:hypothetical protein
MSDVGAEAIDDIVVVPEVELRDLPVGASERLSAVPAQVVGDIVVVTGLAKGLWELVVAALARVCDVRPRSEGSVDADAVVVDLITATDPANQVLAHILTSFLLTRVLT